MNRRSAFASKARLPLVLACALALGCIAVVLGWSACAQARANGIVVPGCSCHTGGKVPEIKLLTPNNLPALGESIKLTVEIEAINGGVGGFYLVQSDGDGLLTPGEGERVADKPSQIVHSTPMHAVNGRVRFDVTWTAPSKKGVALFNVYGVSGDGSGTPFGDNSNAAVLGVAVGCDPGSAKTYYADSDGDGVGDAGKGTRPSCIDLPGWALTDGDCDENRADRHPGAPELCNNRDDDCDGMIDEGVAGQLVYPDRDGDGYGDPMGTPSMDCTMSGYAPNRTDCNDRDPSIHPGAAEACDSFDQDCDGMVDERAEPTCGVGTCARRSLSCSPRDCVPGMPSAEVCDSVDNDCDGSIDEDDVCTGGAGVIAVAGSGAAGSGAATLAMSASEGPGVRAQSSSPSPSGQGTTTPAGPAADIQKKDGGGCNAARAATADRAIALGLMAWAIVWCRRRAPRTRSRIAAGD